MLGSAIQPVGAERNVSTSTGTLSVLGFVQPFYKSVSLSQVFMSSFVSSSVATVGGSQ